MIFFASRRRHTRYWRDWSSDVCSSDLLENGDELRAPVVVTAVHPKIAFEKLIDETELPADFVRDIRSWKTRSGVVKVNLDRKSVVKGKSVDLGGRRIIK